MMSFNKNHGMPVLALYSGLILAALLLAACGGSATQQATSPASQATPTVTDTPPAPSPAPTQATTETPTANLTALPATSSATLEVTSTVTSTVPALIQIQMMDAGTGWGLAESGVFRTTTGGEDWISVTPPGLQNAQSRPSGFFLDAQHAWLITPASEDFSKGTLYRTNDGGQTWESFSIPFAGGSTQFLNPTDGWELADRGAAAGSQAVDIYHTTDGGQTWEKTFGIDPQNPSPKGIPFGGDKTGMTFLNNQVGWVSGTEPVNGFVYLFKTEDGGKTWSPVSLDLPAGYKEAMINAFPPKFFDEQQGVLPVVLFTQSGEMDFYTTHDGGKTWNGSKAVPLSGSYSIVSPQDFVVWDGGASLQWTHDGGQTWAAVAPNINLSQNLAQIDFVSPELGWAIGMNAQQQVQLYKTTDGGKTWEKL